MPHMNQAASMIGGTAAVAGGLMAQATPDASVSNTGIVIGATGLLACLLNGLYPWFKTWVENKRIAERLEEIQAELEKAKADARAEAEAVREKRHAERDRWQGMYYRQQGELSEAQVKIARLEGQLGREVVPAVNTNSEAIRKVADSHDPPIVVETPHLEPGPGLAPFPPGSDDDIAGPGPPRRPA